jgi:trk system potassium uptake protein TrkA
MSEKARSFAVIGLGSFGGTVATELARFGNYVLGVDAAERPVADHADVLAEAIIADGRDEAALREAGVGKYDVAVVAIGEDLEANIVCTMNLKVLGVPTVWAKSLSRTHYRILTKLGADRVIQPEQEVGQHIAQMLHNPAVRDYVSLGNGFIVVHLSVPEKFAGKTLASLALAERHDLRCLGLMRGPKFIAPDDSEQTLEAEDRLLVLGRRAELRRFGDRLLAG